MVGYIFQFFLSAICRLTSVLCHLTPETLFGGTAVPLYFSVNASLEWMLYEKNSRRSNRRGLSGPVSR